MEIGHTTRFYKVRWFWNIMRYGMFWQGLRNRLASIGVDIMPYYWTLEGDEDITPPEIKGDTAGFKMTYLDREDLVYIKSIIKGIAHKDLISYFEEGQTCIGLKCNDDIVAYVFIKKKDYFFRGKTFKFKDDEAYLHSLYTFESYRGRGIAPYLRYHCCKMLKKEGVEKVYSITECLNRASIRFKRKLKVKHTKLYLSINLFNRINKNILLKEFST